MTDITTSNAALVAKILIAMLTAASGIGAVAGLSTVVIAAMSAAITLLQQESDIEALIEKIKSGDAVTTAELEASLTKAIAADDKLKAAIETALAGNASA